MRFIKPIFLFYMLFLGLSVTATTKVVFISVGGVVGSYTPMNLGDTIEWANMTSYSYDVSCHLSPSGLYPFFCDFTGPSCKYGPPVTGHYRFQCTSPDYTYFSGDFYVNDPNAIIDKKTTKTLFTFSPNPVTNELRFTGNGNVQVKLYNLLGKNVAQCFFTDAGILDVTELPTGTYLISAVANDLQTTQLVIINR